jgi:hypothetical protein
VGVLEELVDALLRDGFILAILREDGDVSFEYLCVEVVLVGHMLQHLLGVQEIED